MSLPRGVCADPPRPPSPCNPAQFAKVVLAIVAGRAAAWRPEPERYCGVRVCVLGRLGRDLNIYELCSTRTRRVYLALCSSPLPRHTHSHSLAHAPRPANLHGSGRAAGWPRPPPRPASCPDEAAATGKRPRAALPGRRACGTRLGNLGRAAGGLARGAGGCGPRGPARTRPPGQLA